MKVNVAYHFEIELPDELTDKLPQQQAEDLAKELAQNINFQKIQRACTRNRSEWFTVHITKIRLTRIEAW